MILSYSKKLTFIEDLSNQEEFYRKNQSALNT